MEPNTVTALKGDLKGEASHPGDTELCEGPLTGQHGDEREAVVLGAAPVAGLSQHVSVEHLMVELLDPGLGEDHQHPAGLNLLHELFLQRPSQEKNDQIGPPASKQAPPLSLPSPGPLNQRL